MSPGIPPHAGTETVRDGVRRAASDALIVVGDVETGAEEGEASSGGAVEPVGVGRLAVFQGLEDGEGGVREPADVTLAWCGGGCECWWGGSGWIVEMMSSSPSSMITKMTILASVK